MNCPKWGESSDFSPLVPIVEQILSEERVSPSTLSVTLLEDWHRRLFEGRVAVSYYAGAVRQNDPNRPCLAQNVGAAGGAGRSYLTVPALLAELCTATERRLAKIPSWQMSSEQKVLALANLLANVLTSFLAIHPFLDGNSRMVRLLLAVLTQRLSLPRVMEVLPPGHPDFPSLKQAAMRLDPRPAQTFLVKALATTPH